MRWHHQYVIIAIVPRIVRLFLKILKRVSASTLLFSATKYNNQLAPQENCPQTITPTEWTLTKSSMTILFKLTHSNLNWKNVTVFQSDIMKLFWQRAVYQCLLQPTMQALMWKFAGKWGKQTRQQNLLSRLWFVLSWRMLGSKNSSAEINPAQDSTFLK